MYLKLADDYNRAWAGLNRELKQRELCNGKLADAISELEMHQMRAGFIKDDLHEIRRYIYVHPQFADCHLRVQYNPRRALRFNGSGVSLPPEGLSAVNNGCFLCRENILWQQQGKEMGYELEVGDTRYYAWMNPFPLLPGHTVITTRDHVTQEWELHPNGALSLERLINNLVELATRLPGFIGFYNGINAGASIPGHMHYQFCRRPDANTRFPLEMVQRDFSEYGITAVVKHYPLAVACWQGSANSITTAALEWVRYWASTNRHRLQRLTANFIVTTDIDSGELELFFAPRDRHKPKSSHMSGLVGGLEVLGELVFSSEEEHRALEQGEIDFDALLRIYQDVYTPLFG